MSSNSGYIGEENQECDPRCFDMSSASGYMGAKYVQEFDSSFVACHVPNVACQGVSVSIVICKAHIGLRFRNTNQRAEMG